MALFPVLMSMITMTSTMKCIFGVVKRRLGASQAIRELANKCSQLVHKIRVLLQTLEEGAQVPHDVSGISTALNLRHEEFGAVLKRLEKMNRRTRSTHPVGHTEQFIMAQGWVEKMEAIRDSLVHLMNGIEIIVSSWDVDNLVARVEEILIADATKKNGSGTWGQHAESEIIGSSSMNYVDRFLMTMVKLTDANKAALNQYGNLDKLLLPDALFLASLRVYPSDKVCSVQLTQRSAEILHPQANWGMGRYYKWGNIVEKNLKLAISHFRVASSRGHIDSMFALMEHYENERDYASVLKYIGMASTRAMEWHDWIRCLHYSVAYGFETTQLLQWSIPENKLERAILQSILHFFGVGVPKSEENALDALQPFHSGSYSLHFELESLERLFTRTQYFWHNRKFNSSNSHYRTAIREYEDFLFKENQFLPLITLSHGFKIFPLR